MLVQNDEVEEPPSAPDFAALPDEVRRDLAIRFQRVPFGRVRRYADYWALRDIEANHVRKLAYRNRLSEEDRQSVEEWWLTRVGTQLADTLDRIRTEDRARTRRLMRGRPRRLRSNASFKIWFNTIGPGGRCWFGNRYTTVRRYTFKLRWRA